VRILYPHKLNVSLQNGKIYSPGKLPRQAILNILNGSEVPCLGVLTSFPSNPQFPTLNEQPPDHFALFDISKVDGEMGQILTGFKDNEFPDEAASPEWAVEDE
jgi:hypothetical protein